MSKYDRLLDVVRQMESVVVAFSGGVDSTFLARAALYEGDYRAADRLVDNLRRVRPAEVVR